MALRKATVQVHLDQGAGWRTIDGWVTTVCEIEVVAHPSLEPSFANPPRLSTVYWSVTEPRTGATLVNGLQERRRKLTSVETALARADQFVTEMGGPEVVEAKVAERLADPRYGPAPELAEANRG